MIRHQRSRAKGARQPEGVRYVGRGTQWGNPFSLEFYTREDALIHFRALVACKTPNDLRAWLAPLRFCAGLSCFCPLDQPCHADALIEAIAATFGEPDNLDAAIGPADDVPAE